MKYKFRQTWTRLIFIHRLKTKIRIRKLWHGCKSKHVKKLNKTHINILTRYNKNCLKLFIFCNLLFCLIKSCVVLDFLRQKSLSPTTPYTIQLYYDQQTQQRRSSVPNSTGVCKLIISFTLGRLCKFFFLSMQIKLIYSFKKGDHSVLYFFHMTFSPGVNHFNHKNLKNCTKMSVIYEQMCVSFQIT